MSDDNVVTLSGEALTAIDLSRPPPGPTPSDDVIDRLERALAKAKSGEMQEMALAYVDFEGETGISYSLRGERITLLGILMVLQNIICQRVSIGDG